MISSRLQIKSSPCYTTTKMKASQTSEPLVWKQNGTSHKRQEKLHHLLWTKNEYGVVQEETICRYGKKRSSKIVGIYIYIYPSFVLYSYSGKILVLLLTFYHWLQSTESHNKMFLLYLRNELKPILVL